MPGVQDAAVVAVEAPGLEGMAICCAYVPSSGSELSNLSLKKSLALVLPPYMLPSHWMVLDRMPRNGNGKTDRTWLKEQFRIQAQPRAFAAAGEQLQMHGSTPSAEVPRSL